MTVSSTKLLIFHADVPERELAAGGRKAPGEPQDPGIILETAGEDHAPDTVAPPAPQAPP
jgi:hypothetical protein